MSSVLTITFSPCIDKSASVPLLIPEKKLRCTTPVLEPGGGGINVARAIRKLGGEAIAVFPSGGYTGKFFNHLLALEQVPSLIIETANETRENIIILEESSNQQFRFGMPGTELSESEWKECLQAVEKTEGTEYVVASGSLPPGVPADIYARLARICRSKNIRLVVDTSGEALKQAAGEGVYLLKPNLGELASLAGLERIEPDDVEEAALEVIRKHDCEVMVVSMGAAGAMMITKENTFHARPPQVERKSTVGAGDSMVAGIIYALTHGMGLQQALFYGIASGTAATMNPGTLLCNKEDTDRLYTLIAGRYQEKH